VPLREVEHSHRWAVPASPDCFSRFSADTPSNHGRTQFGRDMNPTLWALRLLPELSLDRDKVAQVVFASSGGTSTELELLRAPIPRATPPSPCSP